MEQILRGDHMDTWGFGPVGKVEPPLPPERITEEVAGKWQDENTQDGEDATM